MYFRMPFSLKLVGLDIQPDAVRLVSATRQKSSVEIQQIASVDLQHHVFNRDIVEHWHALKMALYELVITSKLHQPAAVVSVPASLVKHGCLPVAGSKSPAGIEAMIRATDNLDTQWRVSYEVDDAEVRYSAIQKPYLKKYLDCIRASGLRPVAIDVDVYALLRGMREHINVALDVDDRVGVVQFHQHKTTFVVWQNSAMVLHQTWWHAYDVNDQALWMNVEALLENSGFRVKHLIIATNSARALKVQEQGEAYAVDVVPTFSGVDNVTEYTQPNCAYLTAIGLVLKEL